MQADLRLSCLQTQKTGFLTSRPIFKFLDKKWYSFFYTVDFIALVILSCLLNFVLNYAF